MSTPIAPIEERRLLGIGLVLCSYALLSGLDGSAKWLGLIGLPAMQIMFVRYLVHFAIVSVLWLPRERSALWRTQSIGLELLRAGALIGSTLCNFTAVRYLPLTVTGAIGFTAPMIICVLSVLLFREHVGWRRWTAIGVGFLGILVIVRPGTETFHPATLLSLGGAVFFSIYSLTMRRLAGVDSAATQQFISAGAATLALLPFAFFTWRWPVAPTDWAVFLGIGVLGYLGHQFVTVAHRFAPASTLAPFAYVQIIFVALLSWQVFGQPPDAWFYLGAPIVIGSGLYIWWRERVLSRNTVDAAAATEIAVRRDAV